MSRNDIRGTDRTYSRRTVLQLALGMAGTGILAACGSKPSASTTSPTVSSSHAPTSVPSSPSPTSAPSQRVQVSQPTQASQVATATQMSQATQVSLGAAALAPGAPHSLDELLKSVPGKYSPPVQISTVGLSYADNKYAPGNSINNNPWTRGYKEKYGIEVTKQWEVPSDQYQQKITLTISSGNLPDYFMALPDQFAQLVQAGSVKDLTGIYNKQATDLDKALLTEGGSIAMKSATIDGKLMAIPYTLPNKEGSPLLWVRTDLLKKYGLSEPKTVQDQLKIAETFGKNGIYALALDKQLSTLSGFFNSYHAYQGIWLKGSNGQLVYSSIQPEMKAPLEQLQKMFKAGQLDPEFGVKDITKEYDLVVSGQIGMLYGGFPTGLYPLQSAKQKNPKSDWKAIPIVSVDSQPAKPQVNEPSVEGYWVARNGFEHPEAMLQMLDFWVQAFYTTTSNDVYYRFNQTKNSIPVWEHNAIQADRAFKNIDEGIAVTKLIENKGQGMANVTPEQRDVYRKCQLWLKGDVTNWDWYVMFGPGGSTLAANQYRQQNLYQESQFYGTPTRTMGTKLSTLNDLETQTFTKIIQGGSLSGFDTFVSNWKKLGGDQITQEVNEWYAKQPK